ncbi:MAG: hypothetical protein CL566_05470 [Alphaproteobacteria bacterium]|nr:hypothetical protein [Alphaproteobacteria bacterium]
MPNWIICTALSAAFMLSGIAASHGQEKTSPILTGPIQDMGELRKLQPLPSAQIDPETAAPDATPAERPMRPFSGWVGPGGCTYVYDGQMWGRVQDNRISGMAAEGHNFDFPLADDGSFAGRLPLKRHEETGAEILQTITGQIDGNRLVMDIEFGAPSHPDTFCMAEGVTLPLGG